MTDVVALAAELLAIDSSTGAESGAIDFVARWLVARGWNVNLQEVTRGRANVWASRGGRGVTLSTHLDTVPPYLPPRLQGDRLTGRGAADAKGIAAAIKEDYDRVVDETTITRTLARGVDGVDEVGSKRPKTYAAQVQDEQDRGGL